MMGNDLFDSFRIELLVTAVVGIVTYGFGRLLELFIKRVRERRGPLAGQWLQRIYDSDTGELTKTDEVVCTQIGEVIEADIVRIEPEDQRGRAWTFHGVFRGQELFGHFQTKDLKDPSFGTIFMRQNGRGHLKGSYTKSKQKLAVSQEWNEFLICTTPIPLEWWFCFPDTDNTEAKLA